MKKIVLLSAVILLFASQSANASSFSFGFFAPQPVYVQPVVQEYMVTEYPQTYAYYYPNYVSYWQYQQELRRREFLERQREGRREHAHRQHEYEHGRWHND
jgi:hypothetical protein